MLCERKQGNRRERKYQKDTLKERRGSLEEKDDGGYRIEQAFWAKSMERT